MRWHAFLRSRFAVFAVLMAFCASCGKGEKDSAEESSRSSRATDAVAPVSAGETDAGRELSPEEKAKVLDGILQARAREQAEGLGAGSVTVNGAWHYTGYSHLSPDPNAAIEARLVAVDVTVSGHRPAFDLDDMEIVDGETLVSYGSDPHIEPLTLQGEPMPPGEEPAAAPRAARYLLVYGFPKNVDEFRLFYWGQQLTTRSEKVAVSGWELPYPAPGGNGESGRKKAQKSQNLSEDKPDTEPAADQDLKPDEGLYSR